MRLHQTTELRKYVRHLETNPAEVTALYREMVVFAQHNLIKDPPFTNIDLVSCRNLLIYLQPVLQHKVMQLFNFSLNQDGILFLGTSETVGDMADHFTPLHQRWRLYQTKGKRSPGSLLREIGANPNPGRLMMARPLRRSGIWRTQEEERNLDRLLQGLAKGYLPLVLMVNEHLELLHVVGDPKSFLRVPTGRVINDLSKLVANELVIPVTTGIQRVLTKDQDVKFTNIRMHGTDGLACNISMQIIKLPQRKGQAPLADEEALRHTEERSRFLSLATGVGLWDWDIPNNILHWSESIEPIFGLKTGQFGGTYQDFLACVHPEDRGRNTHQFYSSALHAKAQERAGIEQGLRQALNKNELFMVYQPQVNLCAGRIIGLEALIRWRRGDQLIPPDRFIPIAEESGQILAISEWVLNEACALAARLAPIVAPPFRVAINLSVRQLSAPQRLLDQIVAALKKWDLKPSSFEVEITETFMIQETEAAQWVLSRLRELGIHISLDDFGTGFSSLSYLRRFPVNTLKIDRSFINDIGRDLEDEAIVRSIIALAHTLNMETVAEGIENELQRHFLLDNGCSTGQGYLFWKPMPVQDIEQILKQGDSRWDALPTSKWPGPPPASCL